MDEVRAILGEPKSIDIRPEHDMWFYDCPGWFPPPSIIVSFGTDRRMEYAHIID